MDVTQESTTPRSSSTTTARILLVDDHEIIRKGLRSVLEARKDWEIVGEATTGRDAVKKVEELKPDVVVMDISMPELNGLEAVRQIVKLSPRTEVLVLTMHESEDLVREVLEAGARGYLLKSDASRQLISAVEALRIHRPYLTSRVNEVVLTGYLGGKPLKGETSGGKLTPREREIVQLLAEGLTNKEVATMLHISVKTAETHRTNIMRKLDLHSVSELVRYAVRNHIIEA
ncbi:MAG TPA: response regulator transcription factor [Vicinamibacteria bacterium]